MHCWQKCKMVQPRWESLAIKDLPYVSKISLLGIYPLRIESRGSNRQKVKTTQVFTNRQMDKQWNIIPPFKKIVILINATTWMSPDNISEIRRLWGTKNKQFRERIVFTRRQGHKEGAMSYYWMGIELLLEMMKMFCV